MTRQLDELAGRLEGVLEDMASIAAYVPHDQREYVSEVRKEIKSAIDSLRSQPAGGRDAERYRWLREHVTFTEQETLSPLKVYYRRWYHDTTYRPEADTASGMFDAAIDAAMKESAK